MPTSFFSLRRPASYAPVSNDFEDEYDDDKGNSGIQLQQNSQENNKNENNLNISVEDLPLGTFRIDDDDDEYDNDDDDDEYDNIDLERQLDSPESAPTPTDTNTSCSSLSTRSDESRGIPVNFVCPLTLQVMTDPVNDGCGHCFERSAISSWLEYHEICPISRKPLHCGELKSADALATRIQEFRGQRGDIESSSTITNNTSISGSHNYFASSSPVSPPGMIVESMLLPQELQVLQMIKGKARDRQSRHRFNNHIWAIALAVGLILFLSMCFAIKYLELELRGPI